MNSRRVEPPRYGRFPVPYRWILDQIPRELHGIFGPHGDPDPRPYGDQVIYLYPITHLDGSEYLKPLLLEYLPDDGVPTVFIVGDTLELGDRRVTVIGFDSSPLPTENGESPYLHWQVRIEPVPERTP